MTDLAARAAAAFLGAAVGDALGWPQENRSSNIDRKAPTPAMTFRSWWRRGGGRFSPYEEEIHAGCHSDDTQMLCAVARSLARGPSWYEWLTGVELPIFPLYQRGAGRALLSACRAWAAGVPPWEPGKSTNPSAYFAAGGNGGAMRILPHALVAAAEDRAVDVDRVFCDVAATHGHPRASLGAALQAAALHAGLNFDRTLGYGELIEMLLDRTDIWASMPRVERMPAGWLDAWSSNVATSFEEAWRSTAKEIVALLGTAKKGMSSGALASEHETLVELGCTGTKTVGSGTVSAAGAVYLASRSAANPKAGVMAAAYLSKADTDTLASMTASILGAFAGQEWMAPLDRQVQDHGYIVRLSTALELTTEDRTFVPRVSERAIDRFVSLLDAAAPSQKLEFLDGRTLSVEAREPLRSKTKSAAVERVRLLASDGQTLHVVRVRRGARSAPKVSDQPSLLMDQGVGPADAPVVRVGVGVPVTQLDNMRRFYQDLVGMTPTRVGGAFVTLNDILALSAPERTESSSAPGRISVYVDVLNIQALWQRLQENGTPVIDRLGGERGHRRFRCLDPEGNLLEVREVIRDEQGKLRERDGAQMQTKHVVSGAESEISPETFRRAMVSTVEAIRALTTAIDATSACHGDIPDAGSQAMRELAAEPGYAAKSDWKGPIRDAHTFGGVTLGAASDFARNFAELFDTERTPMYGHLVLARSVLEASVVSHWLNDPGVGYDERVRRGLAELLYNARELVRLGLEADPKDRWDHWNDVATAFGWDVAGGNKPTVGGTGRPSVPDGINKLLLKEGEWRLGKAQWGYLSSVGHVTWYGLAQSVQEPPREDSPLLRPRAGFGTRAGSVYAQAVCVMGALRNAATARFTLMGWVNEDWRAAGKASIAHEAKLISAFPVDPDQPAEADDSDED